MKTWYPLLCTSLGLAACSDDSGGGPNGGPSVPPPPEGAIAILAEPQRPGDPELGRDALLDQSYIDAGFPWPSFSKAMSPLKEEDGLPGRTGKNALVAYQYDVHMSRRGVEIVAPNCLVCHAGRIQGKVVIGLGSNADGSEAPLTGDVLNPIQVYQLAQGSPEELAEMTRLIARREAADGDATNAFAALASHHDPLTQAWQDEPLFDSKTGPTGPLDVPPWWRMKKKNALYANGMGRGDQVHHMMLMTLLSADSVDELTEIDGYFSNVAAFLRSIEPPEYPFAIDASLAERGGAVFMANCAKCHGTYGAEATYPNLLIPLEMIGTDAHAAQFPWANAATVEWLSKSYYGQQSRLEPSDGYVAPPLDGIWATAPFLHNGSVPTLAALLESSKRPSKFTLSTGADDFDPVGVGWKWSPEKDENRSFYDTSEEGHSNAGHTFGDALTADERASVIEYLKTL
jgi:mono/diheme cytochrome c family protein